MLACSLLGCSLLGRGLLWLPPARLQLAPRQLALLRPARLRPALLRLVPLQPARQLACSAAACSAAACPLQLALPQPVPLPACCSCGLLLLRQPAPPLPARQQLVRRPPARLRLSARLLGSSALGRSLRCRHFAARSSVISGGIAAANASCSRHLASATSDDRPARAFAQPSSAGDVRLERHPRWLRPSTSSASSRRPRLRPRSSACGSNTHVRHLRFGVAVAHLDDLRGERIHVRQLRLGGVELAHHVIDHVDRLTEQAYAVGRQAACSAARRRLNNTFQRRQQLRQQRNVDHRDGAMQGMHGAQQFLADRQFVVAALDGGANGLQVLRHFAAQDFQQHRIHRRHHRQRASTGSASIGSGAAGGIGIGEAGLRHRVAVGVDRAARGGAPRDVPFPWPAAPGLPRAPGGRPPVARRSA